MTGRRRSPSRARSISARSHRRGIALPYLQTEALSPQPATDPHSMPLAPYITEVMELLGNPLRELPIRVEH
jgi:hypothetical protein